MLYNQYKPGQFPKVERQKEPSVTDARQVTQCTFARRSDTTMKWVP